MTSFGWCAGIERADRLHQSGYDYIECPLIALKLESPAESGELIARYKESVLPVNVVNLFFPGDLKITGPDVDRNRLRSILSPRLK
ncbi:hypothetical protein K0U00_41230, partial [Paenibacillus sepulcri]|nr:hypothetical protein [Paenibacillus sepulcri]